MMAQGYHSCHYDKFLGVDKTLFRLSLSDENSFFVVGGWNHPTVWAVLTMLIIRRKPFVIWTDTPNCCERRPWIKEKLRSYLLKIIFDNSAGVLVTGKPGVEIVEKMGYCPKKIINFPYWVPFPENELIGEVFFRDSIRFFAIGQLIKRKGYHLAIKALGSVLNRCKKNRNIEFWLFGDGPERNNLESLSKQMGLADIVTFYGWREPEFIKEKIRQADILVHPALWEPYGVAVLEAMALGKPVIGSDKTIAVLDRVRHGVNGFIFPNQEMDQLAKHMKFFIENPDAIIAMGRKARNSAEEWPVKRGVIIIKNLLTNEYSCAGIQHVKSKTNNK
jgi:glycosyltransferase involved in cell wall biosynthesis